MAKTEKDLQVNMSVVETVRKYSYEYDETSNGNGQYVAYGPNNDFPTLMKNCYRQSATLKSIIDGSVNYILGDEVVVNDSAAQFQEKVNRTGMTMRGLIANLALSLQTYGGFAIQVIYSKLNTICELYPLDFSKCRTNEKGTKIYYNKKGWGKYTTKCEEFDRFNRDTFNPEKPTQIFYCKGDYTNNVYPIPAWYGALNDVLTEIECSRYSLNSVASGFSAKYILNFPYDENLTKEQKDVIEASIKEKFCGPDTSSNFMLYFGNENGDNITIEKMQTDDTPEMYISIKDNARSNIFTALRTTPALMGLPSATTGFNSQEYSSAYKLYQKTVISPLQDLILETINKILGTVNAVTITPFKINFDNAD